MEERCDRRDTWEKGHDYRGGFYSTTRVRVVSNCKLQVLGVVRVE